MFVREKKNKSGSISVQIVSKEDGRLVVVETLGYVRTSAEVLQLKSKGEQRILEIQGKRSLFMSDLDYGISNLISSLSNSTVQTIGPELIFGQLYDAVGYNYVDNDMFRHLVIARLAFPLSKLKTCEYLYRYQGKSINISKVYRFIDKLSNSLQEQIEQITYKHTLSILGCLSIVFYDMTTLYFDASDEDDLQKTGFSKEGKRQKSQIYLELFIGSGGYAVVYDIYEGNIHESHTLIPFLEKVSKRFNLGKPIVVVDSGLLSQKNIMALTESGYTYILGARIKNENHIIKQQILSHDYEVNSTQLNKFNSD
jgi:hypothetical protein